MVQLALTLARRVVHREVTLDPELLAALAHVALERLGTTTPATIRLHPEDYTVVAQDSARWGGSTVTVVARSVDLARRLPGRHRPSGASTPRSSASSTS